AGAGGERQQVSGSVGREEQAAGGAQDAGNAFAVAQFVVPNHLAGTVVEGADGGVGPQDAVAAAPAFGFGGDGVVVNAEEASRVDKEQPGLRIKAGGHPVGGSIGTGRNQRSVGSRRRFGLSDRAAAAVNARCPGLFDEGLGDQMLAIAAVEQKEK